MKTLNRMDGSADDAARAQWRESVDAANRRAAAGFFGSQNVGTHHEKVPWYCPGAVLS